MFAAASRVPITAVLIIFELTDDYQIILPLMFALVLASSIARLFGRDTIYTLKLRRRGIDITHARAVNPIALLTGADAMQPVPRGVPGDRPLREVIDLAPPVLRTRLGNVLTAHLRRFAGAVAEREHHVLDGGEMSGVLPPYRMSRPPSPPGVPVTGEIVMRAG